MKVFFTIYMLFATLVHAKLLISPIEAMQENYSKEAVVSKKNILLPKTKFQNIQKNAGIKLNTKIYRISTATKDGEILGYGLLVNRKVRSKNAVVLYFISHDILQGIEVIAFNEPLEYLPTKRWNEQFINVSTEKVLHINRDIPSISGATLSAKSVIDGSAIAFAIYNELLKGK